MKMQYLPLSPKGLPSKEEETPYGPTRVLFKSAEHEVIYRVIFLTGPPLTMSLDWPPPKFAWSGPPLNFLSV